MRTIRLDRRSTPLARLVVVALAALPGAGWGAADDLGLSLPVDARPDTSGAFAQVLAFGRRVVQTVVDSERSVVGALSSAVSAGPTATLAASTSSAQLAARAAAAARAVADPLAHGVAQAGPQTDLSWRVLQGDADTHVPCVSWMADVQPVTTDSLLGGNVLRPSMHLSAEWMLDAETTFGVMPGVAVNVDPTGRRTTNGTLAVTIGKRWAPGVRAYVDVARDRIGQEFSNSPATTLDAGFSLSTGASSQVDIALTHGLTPSAPPFQAGVGVSSSF